MRLLNLFDTYNNNIAHVSQPFIVAEIGVNHEGNMDLAKRLINEAKTGGADAVKFQSYKAKTLASKNSPAYWDITKEPTKNQYELFKKHDSFWLKEMEQLKFYCDELNIEFMSTPFDIESANFLNDLMDVYKISSSDITNKPFIEHICRFNKPIILSTGASTFEEIQEAVDWVSNYNNPLALLHCVLNYPTNDEHANLGMISKLKSRYPNNIIGYSDHTMPKDMKICEIATMLGSVIIEKHFTHDKTLGGNDHYHSMDKKDLIAFRENIDKMLTVLGSNNNDYLLNQKLARDNARRSIVTSRHLKAGDIVYYNDLTWKRPAHGISPKFIDDVIGRKIKEDVPADSILQWEMII